MISQTESVTWETMKEMIRVAKVWITLTIREV